MPRATQIIRGFVFRVDVEFSRELADWAKFLFNCATPLISRLNISQIIDDGTWQPITVFAYSLFIIVNLAVSLRLMSFPILYYYNPSFDFAISRLLSFLGFSPMPKSSTSLNCPKPFVSNKTLARLEDSDWSKVLFSNLSTVITINVSPVAQGGKQVIRP